MIEHLLQHPPLERIAHLLGRRRQQYRKGVRRAVNRGTPILLQALQLFQLTAGFSSKGGPERRRLTIGRF